jgi:hypothetical protein
VARVAERAVDRRLSGVLATTYLADTGVRLALVDASVARVALA